LLRDFAKLEQSRKFLLRDFAKPRKVLIISVSDRFGETFD
jgi:hypothetical protein